MMPGRPQQERHHRPRTPGRPPDHSQRQREQGRRARVHRACNHPTRKGKTAPAGANATATGTALRLRQAWRGNAAAAARRFQLRGNRGVIFEEVPRVFGFLAVWRGRFSVMPEPGALPGTLCFACYARPCSFLWEKEREDEASERKKERRKEGKKERKTERRNGKAPSEP